MIDSPRNLALLGLSITSQGAAPPQEGGAWLHLLGAPLGRVLAGAACSPHVSPISISEVPLGAALSSSKGMHCLWPEISVTALAAGYHVVTPQRLWGETQRLCCWFSQQAGYLALAF